MKNSKREYKTADMNFPYEVSPPEYRQLTAYGRMQINLRVKGFWSDPVHVTVEAKTGGYRDSLELLGFKIEVDCWSGGGTESVIPNNEIAANYSAAIAKACELAAELESAEGQAMLTGHFWLNIKRERADDDRRKAEREAKEAADPAVGEEEATAIVNAVFGSVRDNSAFGSVIVVKSRVHKSHTAFSIEGGSRVTAKHVFLSSGGRIESTGSGVTSKRDLIAAVAESSAESLEVATFENYGSRSEWINNWIVELDRAQKAARAA